MKIISISDTHLIAHNFIQKELEHLYTLYPDAVLVHAGDACTEGTMREANQFFEWFNNLPKFKAKIFVPGNHDACLDSQFYKSEDCVNLYRQQYPDINILINDLLTIDDKTFLGLCIIPDLKGWPFYLNSDQITRLINLLPTDIKINLLINHAPFHPHKLSIHYSYYGIDQLKEYLINNNINNFVCGHIHEQYGSQMIEDINCYYSCSLDENYQINNKTQKPLVFDI